MGHYVPLCNYANSFLNDSNIAEDLVQDVFLHLWKNNDSLELKGPIQNFLFSSVKNKVYEYTRNRKAYQKVIKNVAESMDSQNYMSSESTKYMNLERLSSLLRHLPPKCRNVFALNKFNGLTYTEIAEKEGISVKTVENHMMKALRILRTQYAKGTQD